MKEGWEYKKLGDVAIIINGFAFKSSLFTKEGEKLLRISNIQNDIVDLSDVVFFNKETYKQNLDKYKVYPDDILIALSGATTGKIGINKTNETLYLNQRVAICRESVKTLNHKYLYCFLKTKSLEFLKDAEGVAQPNLSTEQMKNYVLPIPPLSEQQHIVEELDLLSSIIEKKKAQLNELDNMAQSLFYEMFGDPITNEKGWDLSTFKNEFAISSGGTPSTSKKEYWNNGTISWIGSNLCQNKILTENDGKYITQKGFENSSAKLYSKGYVIVALVGATIGKCALLRFDTTTNQNIAGIDVPSNKEFESYFVFYMLQSLYDLFQNIGEGKFKMANLSFVRSLPIIKPPIDLQNQFAERIQAIEYQKELIKKSIKEVETLFNSRMDYYFN